MKFKPEQHIVGKVYDLTQENMNAMLAEIERLLTQLVAVRFDGLSDNRITVDKQACRHGFNRTLSVVFTPDKQQEIFVVGMEYTVISVDRTNGTVLFTTDLECYNENQVKLK